MTITVEEFTSINPTTINLNASLDEALSAMRENGIRHLLVTEDEKIVGIFSERDLMANIGKKWSLPLRVKNIMKTDILYAQTHDTLSAVAYKLVTHKVGSAIILDTDGSLFGIFTTTDALNALIEIVPTGPEESQEH